MVIPRQGSELKAVEEACREASRTVEPLNVRNRVKWFNVFYLTIACCLVTIAYSGMQAVTVISTRSSGKFNIASTVVLAGLLVGKNLAYSSL